MVNGYNLMKIRNRKIPHLRRTMGIVFQDFRLIPNMSVFDNVAFAMHVVGADRRQIRKEVSAMLSTVGLGEKARSMPNQLSGGQQQRVSMGRALMNSPAVVLADEPTGNLDSKNSQEIVELLKLSNKQYGQTLIIFTHDESIALQADRIITIEDGRITKDEVIR